MKLYKVNEDFTGTWDEALHKKAYHEVRELTEEEEKYLEEMKDVPETVEWDEDLSFIE